MIQLTGNRVAILRDVPEDKTEAGILLLSRSIKKKQTGKVVLVGETVDKNLIGTTVVFDPNCGGSPLEHDNQELLLIFKSDIWATLKN